PAGDFEYSVTFVQNNLEDWRTGARIPNALYIGTQSGGILTVGCGDKEGMTGEYTEIGKKYTSSIVYSKSDKKFYAYLDGVLLKSISNVSVPELFELAIGATEPNYGYAANGQIYDVKLVDKVNPENSRYYSSLIQSQTKPTTLILKDEWGEGSTDGELIGFDPGEEWEPVKWATEGDTLFKGIGALGEVSAISEEAGSSPVRCELKLSGFDDSLRGEVLRAKYHGRPVKVHLVALDENYQPEAVETIWNGKLIDAKVVYGEENTIEVTGSNRFEDWDKSRADRFNDESHTARHPGDRAFKYVAGLSGREIYWGGNDSPIQLRA
ncbi:hypothetical protein, partial [Endozoicomonas sp. ONNA1]|uniref:hypothetical protein n=1 Tax=Endozoicomonas sp. ONNA1 TaxID=2828740 RepID=UPI0021482F4E